ncbi:MAG: response regulator [Bacteroidota bacterium]
MTLKHFIEEPSVLLLDDEIPALRALSSLLEDDGVKVVAASSTEEAVRMVAESTGYFSAMVIDVKMNDEDRDGLDVTNEIQHGLCREIPAIIVSAYAQNEAYLKKARQKKLIIEDWLEKPILDDVHDQLIQHIQALSMSSQEKVNRVISIYDAWLSDQSKGLEALRSFILEGDLHDPALLTNTLNYLGEHRGIEVNDFTAHVNFLVYEKTIGSLWEQHGNGYVAFLKGKKVGFATSETELIKTVFETQQRTDFFFAPINEERVSRFAGPKVLSNRYPKLD